MTTALAELKPPTITCAMPLDPRFIDLSGMIFSRLSVLGYAGKRGTQHSWRCVCECGGESVVRGSDLRSNNTTSCGNCSARLTSSDIASRLRERIMSRLLRCGDCWEWIGYRDVNGYGRINIKGTPQLVHAVLFRLHTGDGDGRMCVLHKCDNPPCCNPEHLFLGTQADNMADKVLKNRQPKGEQIPASKLTSMDVVDIRIAYASGTASRAILAQRYGVQKTTIDRVIVGKTWKHVVSTQPERTSL